MSVNFPCRGCWWAESGRCFNDDLGLGPAPRNNPIFTGQNGFEVTNAHLNICAETGPSGRRINSARYILSRALK
jgi:hypothetical protein